MAGRSVIPDFVAIYRSHDKLVPNFEKPYEYDKTFQK